MNPLLNRMLSLPTRFPKTVIGLVLALTALAVVTLINPGLGMDPNPYPLSASHPSMVAYRQLKADYTGTLETALVHLRHPESIYNPATLERIANLTDELERVSIAGPEDSERMASFLPQLQPATQAVVQDLLADGITRDDDLALNELQTTIEFDGEPAPGFAAALDDLRLKLYPVREVTSLANVEYITANGDELTVGEIYEDVPRDPAGLTAVQKAVRDNPIFHRLLVSEDGRSTGILVETYIPDDRADLMLSLNAEVVRLLEKYPGEESTDIAGVPVMTATAVATMQKDNTTFFPYVILIVLALLTVTFRSVVGVTLPLAVVVLSVIWTLAVMAGVGIPLNIMTTALPVFLITIGVADGIHLLSEFRDRYREHGNRALAAQDTLRQLALPVVMTSLTTGAGFIALAYTDVKYIREFGIFVAVGVLVAMVISLLFVPAVLSLGRNRKPERQSDGLATGRVTDSPVRRNGLLLRFDNAALSLLEGIGSFAVRRAGTIVAGTALLMAVAVYGLTLVVPENDFIRYFREDMPIVQATYELDEHMAGSNVVSVILTAPESAGPEPFKRPDLLAAVEGFQRHMESVPTVGKSLSLVDILNRINRVMHQDDPAFDRLPQDEAGVPGRNLVAQYLLLYGNGGGDNLTDFTDSTFQTLNVRLNLKTRSTSEIGTIIDAAQDYAARHFPQGMGMRFAGAAELTTATNDEIVRSQMTSFGISLGLIFLLLLVEFRSVSKGVLTMIPLGVTALMNFGVMGLAGVDLNIGTAIVSSIAIGIGVDFAIHYVSRLEKELPDSATLEEAIRRTMGASGKAITANAITVSLGFVALFGSDMLPMQHIGWMVSQTLLVSLVATLVLIPATVALTRPSFARKTVPEPALEAAAA